MCSFSKRAIAQPWIFAEFFLSANEVNLFAWENTPFRKRRQKKSANIVLQRKKKRGKSCVTQEVRVTSKILRAGAEFFRPPTRPVGQKTLSLFL